eukprot:CAMPEP_0198206532 /NCGR_PEP_ID=MMETSP1445-20131203/10079_1 /TAXON_ID=36898 /ORGANISM="Pyramimonas sp., Strain CCMP2087" /LENGTH=38 /DNA_ID= /DNA_START= /DNA_END= /DNA_ORIENTATION=
MPSGGGGDTTPPQQQYQKRDRAPNSGGYGGSIRSTPSP